MSYISADGCEITEEMIERWCNAYEQGEFPEGERTVGEVVMGRPPLSTTEKTTNLNVAMPVGMKAALVGKAKSQGMSLSAYARSVLANDLMTAR